MAKLTVPVNTGAGGSSGPIKDKLYEKRLVNGEIQKVTVEQRNRELKNWFYEYYADGVTEKDLDHKFQEIEQEIEEAMSNATDNSPLKNKTYEYIANPELVDNNKYYFKEDCSDFFVTFSGSSSQPIYYLDVTPVIVGDERPQMEVPTALNDNVPTEETISLIEYNASINAIVVTTNLAVYAFKQSEAKWEILDGNATSNIPPNLICVTDYVENEYMLKAIIVEKQTLGEKMDNPLENWIYEKIEGNLIDGNTYQLLDEYPDELFTKYEDLFITNWGTQIYGLQGIAPNPPFFNLFFTKIYVGGILNFNVIVFLSENNSNYTCVGYVQFGQGHSGWYEIDGSGDDNWQFVLDDDAPIPASTPTTTALNENFIINEQAVKDVLGIASRDIKLKEKFQTCLTLERLSNVAISSSSLIALSSSDPHITYGYEYKAVIQDDAFIDALKVEVLFNLAQITSENFCPIQDIDTENGSLTLYVKTNNDNILLDRIDIFKNVE